MAKRAKGWCFTLNNYNQSNLDRLWTQNEVTGLPYVMNPCLDHNITYLVIGKEIGSEGTPHLQGYIEFGNPRTMLGTKRILADVRVHVEPLISNGLAASDYCKKDGDYVEFGTRFVSEQGKRSDLELQCNLLRSGQTTVGEIMDTMPMLYHQYGRTLEAVEDRKYQSAKRDSAPIAYWYWGKTGVGKTHKVYELMRSEGLTLYDHSDDKGWWDKYTQQDICLINDYRGNIPYQEVLKMLDKYDYSVSRRNRKPIPFTSKYVIFTSSCPPEEVYWRTNENSRDSIDQLLRRLTVVEVKLEGDSIVRLVTPPDEIRDLSNLPQVEIIRPRVRIIRSNNLITVNGELVEFNPLDACHQEIKRNNLNGTSSLSLL